MVRTPLRGWLTRRAAILSSLATLACLAGGAQPAAAQTVVVDNLGQSRDNGYNPGVSLFVAAPFINDATARTLSSVRAVLVPDLFGGIPAEVVMSLRANAGGLPGAVLATFGPASSVGGDVYQFAAPPISLAPSTQYFVTAQHPTSATLNMVSWKSTASGAWAGPGVLPNYFVYSENSGTTWTQHDLPRRQLFQVNAPASDAVPEPSAGLLFMPAVAALVATRRRRASVGTSAIS